MASSSQKADAAVLADLAANGPSTPLDIRKRLGQRNSSGVWRSVLRMANAGQLEFDPTGRIVHVTTPIDTTTTQEPTT